MEAGKEEECQERENQENDDKAGYRALSRKRRSFAVRDFLFNFGRGH